MPSIVSSRRRMWEVGKDAPSNTVFRFGKPQKMVVSLVEGNYGTPPKFFKEIAVKVKFYSICARTVG